MTDPLTAWLDAMSARARAATPGPWRIPGANIGRIVAPEAPHTNPTTGKCPPYPWAVVADTDSRSVPEWHANAAYLAALDPETVQALVDGVRALEQISTIKLGPGPSGEIHPSLLEAAFICTGPLARLHAALGGGE